VDGHLVAVEVGVEGRAHQRVQLDRLAFDQHRLERLDAQAVQRRCAVQHHGMFADDFFQQIPHDRFFVFHHLLGSLDRGRQPQHFETVKNEGLEQFQRHLLGQTALMQLQRRAHHDDGAAGVVDALAKQVLAEAAAFALDHVGQRFQRALVGAGHRLAATAVVEQRIDRFLQHAFFIAHDDFGRLQFKQPFEPVVAVDNAAVEVVEVGGRETAAVQRHQRTQFGRQHRQHFEDHPLGLDAGLLETFEDLQPLGQLLQLGVGTGFIDFRMQAFHGGMQIERAQQFAHGFRTHQRLEFIAVFFQLGEVVFLGQQLAAIERRHAGLDHHEAFKIEHALDVAQRHVEHHAETAGQRLQEPDVGDRRCQLDVAHALAAHLGQRDFDAALFADHATVLQALVLAAQAFVVLDRTENLGAEQAIALRLEGAVVDGLRLLHFAVRPGADFLRRRQANLDGVELFLVGGLLE